MGLRLAVENLGRGVQPVWPHGRPRLFIDAGLAEVVWISQGPAEGAMQQERAVDVAHDAVVEGHAKLVSVERFDFGDPEHHGHATPAGVDHSPEAGRPIRDADTLVENDHGTDPTASRSPGLRRSSVCLAPKQRDAARHSLRPTSGGYLPPDSGCKLANSPLCRKNPDPLLPLGRVRIPVAVFRQALPMAGFLGFLLSWVAFRSRDCAPPSLRPGEVGALLRRAGPWSSLLTEWRRARDSGGPSGA